VRLRFKQNYCFTASALASKTAPTISLAITGRFRARQSRRTERARRLHELISRAVSYSERSLSCRYCMTYCTRRELCVPCKRRGQRSRHMLLLTYILTDTRTHDLVRKSFTRSRLVRSHIGAELFLYPLLYVGRNIIRILWWAAHGGRRRCVSASRRVRSAPRRSGRLRAGCSRGCRLICCGRRGARRGGRIILHKLRHRYRTGTN
jgi:hypothetical protein